MGLRSERIRTTETGAKNDGFTGCVRFFGRRRRIPFREREHIVVSESHARSVCTLVPRANGVGAFKL